MPGDAVSYINFVIEHVITAHHHRNGSDLSTALAKDFNESLAIQVADVARNGALQYSVIAVDEILSVCFSSAAYSKLVA